MNIEEAFDLILAERQRQERLMLQGKFPWTCKAARVSHEKKLAVLTEEVGEVARVIQELWTDRTKVKRHHLLEELVQVAAVAVAWLESME